MATAGKTQNLLRLWSEYRSSYQTSRSAGGLLSVIERLFEFPANTIPTVQKELNVSFPTASKWVRTLEEDGVLVERTDSRRIGVTSRRTFSES